jgi:N-acetyl-anhydromuramyl-L-alanine amidase AmpD
MKTIPFLLDLNNGEIVDQKSVAQRVRDAGKEHLWSEREKGLIDTVVIHYASAVNIDPLRPFDTRLIVRIFCDLGVSSHYLIDREGDVFLLVPEEKRAWHCGGSIMPAPDNRIGVNEFSIGIELVATPSSGFTKKQYASLALLRKDLLKRYGDSLRFVGHQDIAGKRAVELGLRKDEKVDPGEAFDWTAF